RSSPRRTLRTTWLRSASSWARTKPDPDAEEGTRTLACPPQQYLDPCEVGIESMTSVVELRNVVKKFPGVVALRDMGMEIQPGEVHGLIGENGAGKSSLIKVLTGAYIPEDGEIYVEGEKQNFSSAQDAQQAGIACVYQELNIVREVS